MKEKIVIGHKNPDTDSVASAFVWSRILNKSGTLATPAIFGKPNKETKLVFEKVGLDVPKPQNLADKEVFLVDHNETEQMADGIEEVVGVIDHHKISFKSDSPLFFRVEPLGSTCSVIRKISIEKNIELEKDEIFLLLCGIISDTLNFNSPTTTELDKELGKDLADLLDVDTDLLAQDLFEAKSDLSDYSLKEVIEADYKSFDIGKSKLGIGVSEIVSFNFFENKESQVIDILKEIKKDKKIDYIYFVVINIIKKEALFFFSDEKDLDLAKKAFNVSGNKNPELLEGVASRKKQIVPPISKILEK